MVLLEILETEADIMSFTFNTDTDLRIPNIPDPNSLNHTKIHQ